ncbi:MAG: DedA family protein [Spartobacteria bacterium]|nr:DedA family protein [Spartobacteria bacterium]
MSDVWNELIRQYGYLAVFAGSFIEGETIILIGGFLARCRLLKLDWVIVTAIAGAFAGDQCMFFIGRWFGGSLLQKRPHLRHKADRIRSMVEQHEKKALILLRFMYGMRTAAPIIIGASQFSAARYFWLDFIATITWAFSYGIIGYLFGQAMEPFLGELKRHALLISLTLFIVGSGVFLIGLWLRRKKDTLEMANEDPSHS